MKSVLKASVLLKVSVVLLLSLLVTGCGVNSGLVNQFSANVSNSNVVLQNKNFKVLGTVSGDASDSYVFGIGGNKQNLVAQAKQKMIENAKLEGAPKAIINVTVEEHGKLIFVYLKRTITVHGVVVEFTE
jgi:hypothetical protein